MADTAIEASRFFGMPEDCRGWRQFVVTKKCPGKEPYPKSRSPIGPVGHLLPFAVWVGRGVPSIYCSGLNYPLHESSVRELRKATGSNGHPKAGTVHACDHEGYFVE